MYDGFQIYYQKISSASNDYKAYVETEKFMLLTDIDLDYSIVMS